ncbi:hypothetical protein BJX99DRAFT_263662 [Aspergillus californicus]
MRFSPWAACVLAFTANAAVNVEHSDASVQSTAPDHPVLASDDAVSSFKDYLVDHPGAKTFKITSTQIDVVTLGPQKKLEATATQSLDCLTFTTLVTHTFTWSSGTLVDICSTSNPATGNPTTTAAGPGGTNTVPATATPSATVTDTGSVPTTGSAPDNGSPPNTNSATQTGSVPASGSAPDSGSALDPTGTVPAPGSAPGSGSGSSSGVGTDTGTAPTDTVPGTPVGTGTPSGSPSTSTVTGIPSTVDGNQPGLTESQTSLTVTISTTTTDNAGNTIIIPLVVTTDPAQPVAPGFVTTTDADGNTITVPVDNPTSAGQAVPVVITTSATSTDEEGNVVTVPTVITTSSVQPIPVVITTSATTTDGDGNVVTVPTVITTSSIPPAAGVVTTTDGYGNVVPVPVMTTTDETGGVITIPTSVTATTYHTIPTWTTTTDEAGSLVSVVTDWVSTDIQTLPPWITSSDEAGSVITIYPVVSTDQVGNLVTVWPAASTTEHPQLPAFTTTDASGGLVIGYPTTTTDETGGVVTLHPTTTSDIPGSIFPVPTAIPTTDENGHIFPVPTVITTTNEDKCIITVYLATMTDGTGGIVNVYPTTTTDSTGGTITMRPASTAHMDACITGIAFPKELITSSMSVISSEFRLLLPLFRSWETDPSPPLETNIINGIREIKGINGIEVDLKDLTKKIGKPELPKCNAKRKRGLFDPILDAVTDVIDTVVSTVSCIVDKLDNLKTDIKGKNIENVKNILSQLISLDPEDNPDSSSTSTTATTSCTSLEAAQQVTVLCKPTVTTIAGSTVSTTACEPTTTVSTIGCSVTDTTTTVTATPTPTARTALCEAGSCGDSCIAGTNSWLDLGPIDCSKVRTSTEPLPAGNKPIINIIDSSVLTKRELLDTRAYDPTGPLPDLVPNTAEAGAYFLDLIAQVNQVGAWLDYQANPIVAQWYKFGTHKTVAAIGPLYGCTAVVIVSEFGVYLAHIFERPIFRQRDTPEGESYDTPDDFFHKWAVEAILGRQDIGLETIDPLEDLVGTDAQPGPLHSSHNPSIFVISPGRHLEPTGPLLYGARAAHMLEEYKAFIYPSGATDANKALLIKYFLTDGDSALSPLSPFGKVAIEVVPLQYWHDAGDQVLPVGRWRLWVSGIPVVAIDFPDIPAPPGQVVSRDEQGVCPIPDSTDKSRLCEKGSCGDSCIAGKGGLINLGPIDCSKVPVTTVEALPTKPIVNFAGSSGQQKKTDLQIRSYDPTGPLPDLAEGAESDAYIQDLVQHIHSQDKWLGYELGDVVAQWYPIGSDKVIAGVGPLYGCTSIIIVSPLGVYMSHIFEAPVFVRHDDDGEPHDTEDEYFHHWTVDVITSVGDTFVEPLAGLLGTDAEPGPLHHSHEPVIFVITPGEFEAPAGGPLVYQDRAQYLRNNFEAFIYPDGPPDEEEGAHVIGYHLAHPDTAQDPRSPHGKAVVEVAPLQYWFKNEDNYVPVGRWRLWVGGEEVVSIDIPGNAGDSVPPSDDSPSEASARVAQGVCPIPDSTTTGLCEAGKCGDSCGTGKGGWVNMGPVDCSKVPVTTLSANDVLPIKPIINSIGSNAGGKKVGLDARSDGPTDPIPEFPVDGPEADAYIADLVQRLDNEKMWLGYSSASVVSAWHTLGSDKIVTGVAPLHGCTSVIIMSQIGVYVAHIYEVPVFLTEKSDPANPATPTTDELFQYLAVDMITHLGDTSVTPLSTLIGTDDQWGPLHRNFNPVVIVVTPEMRGAPPGGPLLYEARAEHIESQITDFIYSPGPRPGALIRGYQIVDDETANTPGTRHGKVVIEVTPHQRTVVKDNYAVPIIRWRIWVAGRQKFTIEIPNNAQSYPLSGPAKKLQAGDSEVVCPISSTTTTRTTLVTTTRDSSTSVEMATSHPQYGGGHPDTVTSYPGLETDTMNPPGQAPGFDLPTATSMSTTSDPPAPTDTSAPPDPLPKDPSLVTEIECLENEGWIPAKFNPMIIHNLGQYCSRGLKPNELSLGAGDPFIKWGEATEYHKPFYWATIDFLAECEGPRQNSQFPMEGYNCADIITDIFKVKNCRTRFGFGGRRTIGCLKYEAWIQDGGSGDFPWTFDDLDGDFGEAIANGYDGGFQNDDRLTAPVAVRSNMTMAEITAH